MGGGPTSKLTAPLLAALKEHRSTPLALWRGLTIAGYLVTSGSVYSALRTMAAHGLVHGNGRPRVYTISPLGIIAHGLLIADHETSRPPGAA